MADEFLIKFDLTEIDDQINKIVGSYEDLGSSVEEVNKSIKSEFRNINRHMKTVQSSMDSLNMSMTNFYSNMFTNLRRMSELFGSSSQSFGEFLEKLKEVEGKNLEDFFKESKTGTEDVFGTKTKKKPEDDTFKTLEDSIDKLGKRIEKESKKSKTVIESLHDFVKSEAKKTKSELSKVAGSALPGIGLGKGIIGGLIGAIILGVSEKYRIQQEAGEMLNVFEATGEKLSSEQNKRIVKNFSAFQEKAQWHYAISRKEVQGIVKQAVDAGYKMREIAKTYDDSLGEVGANIANVTLGLDKHFNQASGTAMKNAIDMVTMYGDTIDEAADKTLKIGFAAQRSGIGIQTFTNAVYSSASALSQYGIDMKDVLDVMQDLQKHYGDMGLTDQYAGRQAALGLQGIAEGIAGMSESFMSAISQQLFPEEDLFGARVQFRSGWTRAMSGEDEGFFKKVITSIKQFVNTNVGTDREAGIEFLMKQGMKFEGATALIDIADKLGKNNKNQELSSKEIDDLKKAFQTEGKQMNELLKIQRKLIDSIREIGLGLLQTLVGIAGTLVMGFKGIGLLAAAPFMSSKDRDKAFLEYDKLMSTQTQTVKDGIDRMGKGFTMFGNALGEVLKLDLFESLRNAINYRKDANAFDPSDHLGTGEGGKPVIKSGSVLGDPAAPAELHHRAIMGGDIPLASNMRRPVNTRVIMSGKTLKRSIDTVNNNYSGQAVG